MVKESLKTGMGTTGWEDRKMGEKFLALWGLLLFAVAALTLPHRVHAEQWDFQKGTREIGFGVGYGVEIDENVQTLSLMPRWGYFLTGSKGEGFLRGAWEGVVEPFAGVHTMPSNAAEVGATVRLVYRLHAGGPLVPFVDAGVGGLYEDLRGKNLGSRFLFSSGGGAGVEYLLRKDKSVWLGYRFRHVSNAGTASSNAGLSSNFVVIGISFFHLPAPGSK